MEELEDKFHGVLDAVRKANVGWFQISPKEEEVEIKLKDGNILTFPIQDYQKVSVVDMFCKKCETKIPIGIAEEVEYLLFNGTCRQCFTEELRKNTDVPFVMRREYSKVEFPWHDLVREAPDAYGDRFGVGDEVKVNGIKAKVVRLHEYRDRLIEQGSFLAQVIPMYAGKSHVLNIPTEYLKALTNEHVEIPKGDYKELIDVPSRFNPKTVKDKSIRKVFENDVARAIWMVYRRNHLMTDDHLNALNRFSLSFAERVRKEQIKPKYMFYKFKRRFEKDTGLKMDDSLIAVLVPYLNGEKKATYVVQKEKAA
jgi:hypothetical protein